MTAHPSRSASSLPPTSSSSIKMRFSSLALLALAPALALASNVVDLTTDNFSEYVGQAKGALVEFYAPWSVLCSPRSHRCKLVLTTRSAV